MQQSKYLVSHSSAWPGPALPAAAVPPKFGTGSQPSEHCSSIRRRLLTHTASTHTSCVLLQLRVTGKQLILQKEPLTIYPEVLSHRSSDATELCQRGIQPWRSRSGVKAGAQSFGAWRSLYSQCQPLLGLGSSSRCCRAGASAGTVAEGGH